jgi:hypothetical protein
LKFGNSRNRQRVELAGLGSTFAIRRVFKTCAGRKPSPRATGKAVLLALPPGDEVILRGVQTSEEFQRPPTANRAHSGVL